MKNRFHIKFCNLPEDFGLVFGIGVFPISHGSEMYCDNINIVLGKYYIHIGYIRMTK